MVVGAELVEALDNQKAARPKAAKKRGPKRGSTIRRWTEPEKNIIRNALDTGRTVKDVHHLFDGRTKANLHNAFNAVRRKRRGVCTCGKPRDREDRVVCLSCRTIHKNRRETALSQGLCGQCGVNKAEATLTRCTPCYEKSLKYQPKPKPTDGKYRIMGPGTVRWLANGTPRTLLSLLPFELSAGRFVDLFGGSAAYALTFQDEGWQAVYNDIHPALVGYIRSLKASKINDILTLANALTPLLDGPSLRSLYRNPPHERDLLNATVFFLMAHNVEGRDLKKGRLNHILAPSSHATKRLRERAVGVSQLTAHQGDFAKMIEQYDSPDTLFFADPPWIQNDASYEYKLTEERHIELSRALINCQGNYLIVSNSSRKSMQVLQHHPYLYWWITRQTGRTFRQIIASNMPLNSEERINAAKYGIKP